ncbi:GNAT family N-acetyltransferase [uncultured Alsobacter sp.]|uniref:GNAT family N-acetyltransferase n=1 Tax=uncultured Alsobacter sp. TaxID=1748258 RepID=UPI0025F307B2|nr:GNAT family N-acetyltransferase [uncultured Alsobacter sp.]
MIIRPFEAGDAPALAPLLEQMQAHYGVACPPRDEIVASLLDLPPGNRILLAQLALGHLAGFAALATVFPGPGLRKGLFLKELYVDADRRGEGIGKALMQAIARVAAQEGFGRVDWTADRTKPQLSAFYEGLGATAQDEKQFYRISGDALATLATTS